MPLTRGLAWAAALLSAWAHLAHGWEAKPPTREFTPRDAVFQQMVDLRMGMSGLRTPRSRRARSRLLVSADLQAVFVSDVSDFQVGSR